MDFYFNIHKIKYATMDKLLANIKYDLFSDMNLYINLEKILRKMCNVDMDLYLKSSETRVHEFISNVYNLASHYRLYFSRKGIFTNIYFYLQYPITNPNISNKQYIQSYRNNYSTKLRKKYDSYMVYTILKESMKYLNIMTDYVPRVYFIKSFNVESSCIPSILSDIKPTGMNIILTSDIYEYQYVNKDMMILISKQEKSKLLTKDNILDDMSDKYDADKCLFTTSYLSFILSIYGSSIRNIPKIKGFGFKKIVKMINSGVLNNAISSEVCNIDIIKNILSDTLLGDIINNYKCTDIPFQNMSISESMRYKITEQVVDKDDINSLRIICERYFDKYPINITELTTFPIKEKLQMDYRISWNDASSTNMN